MRATKKKAAAKKARRNVVRSSDYKGSKIEVVAKAVAHEVQVDGKVQSAGQVRLDGGKYGKMAFRSRPTHQNQAIGRQRRDNHYTGGAIWI